MTQLFQYNSSDLLQFCLLYRKCIMQQVYTVFILQSLFLKLILVLHLVLIRGSARAAVASNFLPNVNHSAIGCDLFTAVASSTTTRFVQ